MVAECQDTQRPDKVCCTSMFSDFHTSKQPNFQVTDLKSAFADRNFFLLNENLFSEHLYRNAIKTHLPV